MKFNNSRKDSAYNINVNELVHSFIREFSMACKKAGIYGAGHPLAKKAIEKPFLLFDKIFLFKKYINLNLQQEHLYLLNIRLKDSVFNEEIIKYMQILDIKAILFERTITLGEFEKFISRFVKRVNLSDHSNLIHIYLQDEKITSVEVNSERAYNYFELHQHLRGDVSHDFSLKNLVLQALPNDIEQLAKLSSQGTGFAETLFVDYYPEVIQPLLPEKINTLPTSMVEQSIDNLLQEINSRDMLDTAKGSYSHLSEINALLEFHPDFEKLTQKLHGLIADVSEDNLTSDDTKTPTAKIKIETARSVENLMNETFSDLAIEYDINSFTEAFERLIKTGQFEKANETAEKLVDYLGDTNYDFRQKSLNILMDLVISLPILKHISLYNHLMQVIMRNLFEKKETFEYSEFIWQLIEKCLQEKQYKSLSQITNAMHLRRKIENNVTVYDSLAIKKVYMNFNQREIIGNLIDEMIKGVSPESKYIKDILIATGSEEVAMALSDIISHPIRQVRQTALKILGELGHASLEVFSRILIDDEMFEREEGRRELSDNKWYIIRNSIFVFGLLKDEKAAIPLRLRINDPDVRVRREIISALERIGGEESVDILMMMAGDADKEIRESAVITIGLIGNPETAPLLISLAKTDYRICLKAINALGRIGGNEAKAFLSETLSDEDKIRELASGELSREDLKLAIVRSLGTLGDTGAIKIIKEFNENLSTTQKLFFKNSQVNKAIKEILSKK